MEVALTVEAASRQIEDSHIDQLVKSIAIPPRPSVVAELQQEMAAGDPDPVRIARLVAQDVALTAAVLKSVNSPFYGLTRRAETLGQAISLLGQRQVGVLVTGLVLRGTLRGNAPNLVRFWDVSAKRSYAMAQLAKALGGVPVDVAQSFGLFCDVGIPLLMQRFPDYAQTLKRANEHSDTSFTAVEQASHDTDHALIGALMARSWGVSQSVCLAIRLHHDYEVFLDAKVPAEVARLIAMALVAELAIQRFARMNASTEWTKGGDRAVGVLTLSDADVEEWVEMLVERFAAGTA
jgi:HD-like signal output (HDOD) protein